MSTLQRYPEKNLNVTILAEDEQSKDEVEIRRTKEGNQRRNEVNCRWMDLRELSIRRI